MLSVVLQIKPEALHMLGKAAANWALSLGPQMHCFKNSSRSRFSAGCGSSALMLRGHLVLSGDFGS